VVGASAPQRVLVAPDKFKGTVGAVEIGTAIADAAAQLGLASTVQPLADGGEGTLGALGGANRVSTVTGPLGDPVEAAWRLGSGHEAVIEMAQASGLELVGGADGNDPVAAQTFGTGELIDIAVQRGARRVVVGVGGSASTDGGWGAVQALQPVQRLRGLDLVVACDVRTAFLDAAEVFAPQKGATVAQVELLRRRLVRLAQVYEQERGVDVTTIVGAGAAGGLAGGLASVGASLVDGFEVVADACGLYELIEESDLVVTGEGQLDQTSFDGKVVGGVVEMARDAGVPVLVIAGSVADGYRSPVRAATLAHHVGVERAMNDPVEAAIEVALVELARHFGLDR
jgi:glycerate kinase